MALCPSSAIRLTKNNSRGVYLPSIDDKACNQCRICFDVCPGHSVDFKELNENIFGKEPEDILLGNYLGCYVGYATDYKIRYDSASGGLVTSLLIFTLEKGMIDGALVTRMKRDNPLEPEPFIAKTKEEVISAAKSKYCPVPANIALREILERDGKYAVVGLPCHIQGIRKAETVNKKLRERIALHFGLVCNHAPTFLATEYLLQKLGVSKNQVSRIDYRGKGWPGQMTITLKNAKTKFVPYFCELYWGSAFQCFFYPKHCATCIDKVCELADISFMDAWLPELCDDRVGESIIVVRNPTGRELTQAALAAKVIELEEVPSDKVIQSQSLSLVRRRYSAIISLLKTLGKQVPTRDRPLLKAGLTDYSRAALLSLLTYISEKRRLWFLVSWYSILWKLARSSRQRLRATKRCVVRLFCLDRAH